MPMNEGGAVTPQPGDRVKVTDIAEPDDEDALYKGAVGTVEEVHRRAIIVAWDDPELHGIALLTGHPGDRYVVIEAASPPKPPQPAGWAFPGRDAAKAHYFPEGDARSLCGRWGYIAELATELIPNDRVLGSSDDCATCRKRLVKSRVKSRG